jgi:hypothetical protein
MDFALRDIGALAAARRKGKSLDTMRAAAAGAEEKDEAVDSPNIASALEALRAVLPATLITLYTTGVLLLQNITNAVGAETRAAQQAALAVELGAGTPALKAALANMSAEPSDFAWARVLLAAVGTVLVAFYAYTKAQTVPGRRVLLEPTVTTGAFVAWAIASPGTFLAAYLNANELAVTTILVAVIAAAALWVISSTKLSRKEAG